MNAVAAPELAAGIARLAPYARASFARALHLAARLHSEEIAPEHWLAALLEDESCAATRVVLHAFADPETIGVEVLALCAGIMVVGSSRTLPFSVLGVTAVRAARADAHARGAPAVETTDLFRAAARHFPTELRARLGALSGVELDVTAHAPATGASGVDLGAGLFRNFTADALRALSAGARFCAGLGRDAIGPTHLGLGVLEMDPALRASTGLTAARLRLAASGIDADTTPLPDRSLGADARLRALLTELPDNAATLDVLGWLIANGSGELTALLRRQKVTPALFERCRGVYQDPDEPTS